VRDDRERGGIMREKDHWSRGGEGGEARHQREATVKRSSWGKRVRMSEMGGRAVHGGVGGGVMPPSS